MSWGGAQADMPWKENSKKWKQEVSRLFCSFIQMRNWILVNVSIFFFHFKLSLTTRGIYTVLASSIYRRAECHSFLLFTNTAVCVVSKWLSNAVLTFSTLTVNKKKRCYTAKEAKGLGDDLEKLWYVHLINHCQRNIYWDAKARL